MQMQKKITHKEDGRFLTYYHFPDTATSEETAVFTAIEEIEDERRKTEDGGPEHLNTGRPLVDRTPEHPIPNTGGGSHV